MTPDELRELAAVLAEAQKVEPVKRLTYTRAEAAQALGISANTFDRHVAPHLPRIQSGSKLRLFRVEDIEAWAKDRAEYVLGRPPE